MNIYFESPVKGFVAFPNEVATDDFDILKFKESVYFRSKKIVDWLNANPVIKWSLICKELGIDRANFHKILKSEKPSIKPENIIKLENELKKYGYIC